VHQPPRWVDALPPGALVSCCPHETLRGPEPMLTHVFRLAEFVVVSDLLILWLCLQA
jgi:hypothetical protein